ncbi:hypothetical protein GH733_013355 [Mirounga leonina]|nr:hypothetical protein GH733_013355 [Mirounga leonina]
MCHGGPDICTNQNLEPLALQSEHNTRDISSALPWLPQPYQQRAGKGKMRNSHRTQQRGPCIIYNEAMVSPRPSETSLELIYLI